MTRASAKDALGIKVFAAPRRTRAEPEDGASICARVRANPTMTKTKKILLGIGGALALGLLVILGLALMQPDNYEVERSRVIAADADAIMPQLTDLQHWAEWSPWSDLDPNQTTTFSDPASGVDAWYAWEGNEDVGKGKMTITSIAGGKVAYDLHFIEPFEDSAVVELSVAPEGEGSRVTWTMLGHNNFIGKIFCVFMDMDAMIGADFERGLERLDAAVGASG